jgi:hypothetical protein
MSIDYYRVSVADLLAQVAEGRAHGGDSIIADHLVAALMHLPMMAERYALTAGPPGDTTLPPPEPLGSDAPAGAVLCRSFMRWAVGELDAD